MNKEPLEVVLSFVEEMNDWEHKMYLVDRVESGGVLNHQADQSLLPNVSAEEFKKEYYVVFNKHCTEKQRKYGGFPSGWSRHGQYQGATKDTVVSINEVNNKRAEVIIKGGLFPENYFLFVVLYKGGAWLIDSAKTCESGHWDVHYL